MAMTDRAPAYPEISAQDTARRLTDSFRSVEWAVSIVPPQWTHALPDYYGPNDWTVAMNLAHLVVYEEKFATPLLEALAAGDDGEGAVPSPGEGWLLRDATAIASEPVTAARPSDRKSPRIPLRNLNAKRNVSNRSQRCQGKTLDQRGANRAIRRMAFPCSQVCWKVFVATQAAE